MLVAEVLIIQIVLLWWCSWDVDVDFITSKKFDGIIGIVSHVETSQGYCQAH